MRNKSDQVNDPPVKEQRITVPVDVQINLAENRRLMAETRYEINIRRGRGWLVHYPEKENEHNA